MGSLDLVCWVHSASLFPCSEIELTIFPKIPCSQETQFIFPSKWAQTSYHPTKESTQSVGYDQYSAYGYTVPPVEKGLIKTNIQIVLPSGCYGRVAPHLDGIIDEVYGGNVGVIVCPEIEEFQILNNAEGGSGGFDSTGNN
ncbi:hypothetical protein FD754_020095 [Muntiacus muntjak]|uniref:dUTP diphosphatase n=1 Tax=Muntiacus muntjak TaxID=9888 RepID=A0A5N3V2E5_MUNMU|nr:hypothetical protein FD754_020095 [Muntiacus muntjak]